MTTAEVRAALGPLISYAIAPPVFPASEAARDRIVAEARALLAGLPADGVVVTAESLRRWNACHGNSCRATTLGPDARCTCGLSAALAAEDVR